MTRPNYLIAGRCPGALQPMSSGDGLIIRIRPKLSKLSAAQLESLAAAAARFGNGTLYLSNRANLHIRAISPANHGPALAVLKAAELADRDPAVEAIRNVMVTPAITARGAAVATELERVLAERRELQNLPAKFGAAVQEGEALDPAYVSDITFLVRRSDVAMVLDGDPGRARPFPDAESAAEGFVSTAIAFLNLRAEKPEIRRMRDAVRELRACYKQGDDRLCTVHRARHDGPLPAGDLGGTFGIGFAFGEVTHRAAAEIASVMRRQSIAEAWLTPHRILVFPKEEGSNARFIELAACIGGIADPSDIRLRIHACLGAPSCSRGTVAARMDAEAVLAQLPNRMGAKTIHISGCEKGCAYRGRADIAAIGSNGCYGLCYGRLEMRRQVTGPQLPRAVAELLSVP